MPKLIKTSVNVEGRVSEQYAIVDGDELTPWGADEELGIVGFPTPRVDGPARASGEAIYTYDLRLPGMSYAAVVRATIPSGRVVEIDTARARELPGVLDIMTCADAPAIRVRNQSHLLSDTVLFAGQPIAIIVATDPAIARDAARLVEPRYEPRPFVAEPEAALRDGAPAVGGAKSGNVWKKPQIDERGDVQAGFATADAVVELTVRTPTQMHNAFETHGCVAQWEGDQLTIWESTQGVYAVREFAARKLGLPLGKVRVIATFMGGGFGAKGGGGAYTLIAATLAKRLRRPVQLMYDREGENLETGNRGRAVQRIKIGAKSDGTLTAIEYHGISEGGAYMGWLPSLAGPSQMMYRCPNVRTETIGALTNLGPMDAFRAPGFVEGVVPLEAAMDELAARLGLDPLALRRRNIPAVDQSNDLPFSSFPIEECYRRASDAIGWQRRDELPKTGRYRRGLGMASQIWWGGGGPPAYAEMHLHGDGTATVHTGVQDIGTGTRTILAQVAAEELGLALGDITVAIGDSLQGPLGPVSGGSVTTGSMTPAVRSAAADLRTTLCDLVAQMHDLPAEQLEVRGGKVYRGDDEVIEIRALLRKLGEVQLLGKGSRGPNPDDVSVVTSGAQFVEVEVDTVTGRVRVLRVVAAHDSGRIINPQTFNSQIYGGVIQGIGYALTEERIVDEHRGAVLNPNLEWYKLPTIADIPPIENILIDIPDPRANTTGAKGAGEPGIIPTAAAIANAVADALGVRIDELPITPARVLEALEEQNQGTKEPISRTDQWTEVRKNQ